MLLGDFVKNLFCFAPVTFKSDQNRYLMPDILEALTVIGWNFVENFSHSECE